MSRWDIFRWRTLAGGPPCRQGRQRFPHRAPLSPRPKRVPPFGISDGGGTRVCAGRWRGCPLRHAFGMTPPPKGEARLSFAQAFGDAHTWLSLRGRYVPVGRCPAADRGGSRDAGAVRRLRGQVTSLPIRSRGYRPYGRVRPGSWFLFGCRPLRSRSWGAAPHPATL